MTRDTRVIARMCWFPRGFVYRRALPDSLEIDTLGSSQQKPDKMPWEGDGLLKKWRRLIQKHLLLLAGSAYNSSVGLEGLRLTLSR